MVVVVVVVVVVEACGSERLGLRSVRADVDAGVGWSGEGGALFFFLWKR